MKAGMRGETRVNDETTGRQARPFHMRVFIRFLHFVFLFTRGATLGVRAACFDEKGRIFLVRHTYLPGWYLPGGGVERGETLLAALHKEIREEGNLEATSKPELFHVYLNLEGSNRDHVGLGLSLVRHYAAILNIEAIWRLDADCVVVALTFNPSVEISHTTHRV